MELRHLRWFLAIVEAGSMSAAAREGHITQPALTAMISQLERDLGVRLLHRGRDGVSTTAAGAAILDIARRMVDDAELAAIAARTEDAMAQEEPERAVRLAITDPGLLPHVAPAIAAARFAGIRVTLIVGRHRPWEVDGVLRREFDLAVLTSPVLDHRVESALIGSEDRGILVGPRNELFEASVEDVTFAELSRHAAVDAVEVPPAWIDEWAYRTQMNGERMRRSGPPVDSMSGTFLSALTTDTVAFVPEQIGRMGETLGLRYLRPVGGPRCDHMLVWRRPLSTSARIIVAAATAQAPPSV